MRSLISFTLIAVMATSFAPPASAVSDCVALGTSAIGEGLRVIADAGRQLAFGIVSGEPGDGAGAVVVITPESCGAGSLDLSQINGKADDPMKTIEHAPRYIPLP